MFYVIDNVHNCCQLSLSQNEVSWMDWDPDAEGMDFVSCYFVFLRCALATLRSNLDWLVNI